MVTEPKSFSLSPAGRARVQGSCSILAANSAAFCFSLVAFDRKDLPLLLQLAKIGGTGLQGQFLGNEEVPSVPFGNLDECPRPFPKEGTFSIKITFMQPPMIRKIQRRAISSFDNRASCRCLANRGLKAQRAGKRLARGDLCPKWDLMC